MADAVLRKTVDKKRVLNIINSNIIRAIEDIYGGSGYTKYKELQEGLKLDKKNKMLEAYNNRYKLKSNL